MDVRRLAAWIVLCCAWGGCSQGAPQPVVLPPIAAADAVQSPAPTSPAEPEISAQPQSSAEPAVSPEAATPAQSAVSEEALGKMQPEQPSTAVMQADFHRTPERFGGIPASDAASGPAAPSRPRLRVEKAIGVTTMRVVKDDNPEESSPAAKCEVQSVQILRDKPVGKTREVATLNVDGAPAQHEDILSLLKRKACEAGANRQPAHFGCVFINRGPPCPRPSTSGLHRVSVHTLQRAARGTAIFIL